MSRRPSGIRNTFWRLLGEESGLLRQFAILRENQAELQQQTTSVQQLTASLQEQTASLQQQVAALQQQIAALDARILPEHIPNLDFPFRFSARQMVNELTGASQGVQKLLSLYYLDLARRGGRLPDLGATEFRCFSQNGEDGLLLYVFSVVGTTNKKALEICAGDGIECNTANLIINHGWTGLLFDGDDQNVKRGNEFFTNRCPDTFDRPPSLVAAWITKDNVNDLINGNGFSGPIDLLSLDMDSIDYWIWQSLTAVLPRVVILEFNSILGPYRSASVPYSPAFRTDHSKHPIFGGASLEAFVKLGRDKGYRLIGIERRGFNAVFLHADVGREYFQEISTKQAYEQNPILQGWNPGWIPDPAERPEWAELVEV